MIYFPDDMEMLTRLWTNLAFVEQAKERWIQDVAHGNHREQDLRMLRDEFYHFYEPNHITWAELPAAPNFEEALSEIKIEPHFVPAVIGRINAYPGFRLILDEGRVLEPIGLTRMFSIADESPLVSYAINEHDPETGFRGFTSFIASADEDQPVPWRYARKELVPQDVDLYSELVLVRDCLHTLHFVDHGYGDAPVEQGLLEIVNAGTTYEQKLAELSAWWRSRFATDPTPELLDSVNLKRYLAERDIDVRADILLLGGIPEIPSHGISWQVEIDPSTMKVGNFTSSDPHVPHEIPLPFLHMAAVLRGECIELFTQQLNVFKTTDFEKLFMAALRDYPVFNPIPDENSPS